MAENDQSRDVFTSDGRKIHGARLARPDDTQHDFVRWAFEGAGENPLVWQASARDLMDAAEAVKARVHPLDGGLMHSLAAVQAMLLGLALECLLKGLYIKRYRVWEESDKAHAIVKDGAYLGVQGAGDHQLLQLAAAAGVTLSEDERSTANRLTDFVLYAGRYPVPTRVENMKPIRTEKGKTIARGYISSEELETAEALVSRLMIEVEPWR